MKRESYLQQNWTPTSSPKVNPKRSVSFPPITQPGGHSHPMMGKNYVPMFIVRPISDDKMKMMYSQQPVRSYSSHSPNWIESGMGK